MKPLRPQWIDCPPGCPDYLTHECSVRGGYFDVLGLRAFYRSRAEGTVNKHINKPNFIYKPLTPKAKADLPDKIFIRSAFRGKKAQAATRLLSQFIHENIDIDRFYGDVARFMSLYGDIQSNDIRVSDYLKKNVGSLKK